MIKRVNIPNNKSELFASAWELYVEAFPANERREMDYQLETMLLSEYHFDVLIEDGKFIGILGWWDLSDFRYIEHFAIHRSLRSGGYGAKVLTTFSKEAPKPILLEVEHPDDALRERRIEFYKRQGFELNLHAYSHPPYIGNEYVDLLIMTYPNAISAEVLDQFKQLNFPLIHFKRDDTTF